MKHLEIERLRAVAVLLTMLTHIGPGRLPFALHQGWAGVDLFFVISGFVITLSLLRSLPELPAGLGVVARVEASRLALKQFFVRRAWRILPLALTVLALTLALSFAFNTKGNFGTPHHVALEALTIVTGVYNYTLQYHPEKTLAPYWSLVVEEHFYLLMPFLLIAARTSERRITMAIAIAVLVAVVVRPLTQMDLKWPHEWFHMRAETHHRVDGMAFGVLLALLRARGWGASLAVRSRWLQTVVVAALAGVWLLPGLIPAGGHVPSALLVSLWVMSGAAVFLGSLDAGHVLAIPVVDRMLVYIGSRSYALYLTHVCAISLMGEIFLRLEVSPGGTTKAALGAAAAFGLAELAYRFIEVPGIAAGKRACARFAPLTPATYGESRASRG